MGQSPQHSDERLLARIQSGDQEALAELYERYRPSIYRFAMSLTQSVSQIADEVVQETFLAILQRPAGYHPSRGSLKSYLLGIARKQAFQRYRRERLTAQLCHDESDQPAWTEPQPDPLTALEQEQRRELVARAVESLPPVYREVIVLCQLEDVSYRDAASILDVSIGAVRSRLHRARSLLLKKLSRSQADHDCPVAAQFGRSPE